MSNVEKSYYRIRLTEKSKISSKMVNGVTVTKQWQLKTGDASSFPKLSDVEIQAVQKVGESFVPVDPVPSSTETSAKVPPLTEPPSFESMTVDQLKAVLAGKGVAQSELRAASKADLINLAKSKA